MKTETPNASRQMPEWGLPALAWMVSAYFFVGFVNRSGFPPTRALIAADAIYVLGWLFFLFLPFFRKVKIGSLELERELEKTRGEVREFKAEVRNSLSVLSTNVNTIGGMHNQLTVNFPTPSELRDAQQEVRSRAPEVTRAASEVEREFVTQEEDTNIALVKTRIEIERLLRRILRKQPRGDVADETKYMSVKRLFDLFVKSHEEYAYLAVPLSYVLQASNAAAHAQSVTEAQAREALSLGAQVLAVLRPIAPLSE